MTTKELPEFQLLQKLRQIENAFRFLEHLNSAGEESGVDLPRNVTEKSTVRTNLKRVEECRDLAKYIFEKNQSRSHQPVDIYQLAEQQFLHDS